MQKLDPLRLKRQEELFNLWKAGKLINGLLRPAIGLIEAVAGFGKTMIAILAIKYMNKLHPERTTIVVLPTVLLLADWLGNKDKLGHIKEFGLQNVQAFIVNTYVTYVGGWKCDLLICDECHRYANITATHFSQVLPLTTFRFFMGLSATLTPEQIAFFATNNIPLIATVGNIEAQREGFVAPSKIFNLGIPLSREDSEYNDLINKRFKFYSAFFMHERSIVFACNAPKDKLIGLTLKDGKYLGKKTSKEWKEWFSRANKGDINTDYSIENISRNAAQYMSIMSKRKTKWQNFPSKIEVAVEILKKFPLQTIVFSETAQFADRITAQLPNIAISYHTRLKSLATKGDEVIEILGGREESTLLKEQGYTIEGQTKRKYKAIQAFLDPNDPHRILSTVRAVDEGVDIPNVSLGLMVAYNSTTRQDGQRKGRAERKDYNNLEKCAIIINLYMMGTQEEKWLRAKQKGSTVQWVTSVAQINPTRTISLGSNGPKEITLDASNIETRAIGSTS